MTGAAAMTGEVKEAAGEFPEVHPPVHANRKDPGLIQALRMTAKRNGQDRNRGAMRRTGKTKVGKPYPVPLMRSSSDLVLKSA